MGEIDAGQPSDDDETHELTPAAADALEALATEAVLDLVVEQQYTGATYDELVRRLVLHAFKDLTAAVKDGSIVRRCFRAGYGLKRHASLQRDSLPRRDRH